MKNTISLALALTAIFQSTLGFSQEKQITEIDAATKKARIEALQKAIKSNLQISQAVVEEMDSRKMNKELAAEKAQILLNTAGVIVAVPVVGIMTMTFAGFSRYLAGVMNSPAEVRLFNKLVNGGATLTRYGVILAKLSIYIFVGYAAYSGMESLILNERNPYRGTMTSLSEEQLIRLLAAQTAQFNKLNDELKSLESSKS